MAAILAGKQVQDSDEEEEIKDEDIDEDEALEVEEGLLEEHYGEMAKNMPRKGAEMQEMGDVSPLAAIFGGTPGRNTTNPSLSLLPVNRSIYSPERSLLGGDSAGLEELDRRRRLLEVLNDDAGPRAGNIPPNTMKILPSWL